MKKSLAYGSLKSSESHYINISHPTQYTKVREFIRHSRRRTKVYISKFIVLNIMEQTNKDYNSKFVENFIKENYPNESENDIKALVRLLSGVRKWYFYLYAWRSCHGWLMRRHSNMIITGRVIYQPSFTPVSKRFYKGVFNITLVLPV